MLYLIWFLSLLLTFYAGYQFKRFKERVDIIEEAVKAKVDKPKEEPESMLIDPTDDVQTAIYEHKKMMEKLNE